MRVKWFIIALILVVLPAVILSVLAARTIGHYEVIMQAEMEQDAARILASVDSAIHNQALNLLEMTRLTFARALTPNSSPEELTPVSRRLARENPAISDVYVFMNPWGFLTTSNPDQPSPDTVIANELLANELRKRLANAELKPHNSQPGTQNPEPRTQNPQLSFFQNARACYFAPMPGTASIWAGYTADRTALIRLLDRSLSEHQAAGISLSYVCDELCHPQPVPDVIISDSLSSHTQPGTTPAQRGIPGLPIIASTFLMPPLDRIELIAQAAPGVEVQKIAAARKQLYGWGLAVVVAWVLLGIAIILRQTIVEIHQARQRGEFLLGVSHDLRTPLASMRMLAETLAKGHVRKSEQPRFMNTIVSECDRLSRLIERVLYLVRYGQGALVYSHNDINLSDLVHRTVAELKTYASSLQVRIAPDLPSIQGDRAALSQVILNLLDNAIKYGKREEEADEKSLTATPDAAPLPSAQPVRVELTVDLVTRRHYRWSKPARWVCLSVRDFGMGIDKHEQRKIFHRFYRSIRAHDRNVSGVGLGLALCRHVIRSHGGWIEVKSKVGEGTTFSVYLKSGWGM